MTHLFLTLLIFGHIVNTVCAKLQTPTIKQNAINTVNTIPLSFPQHMQHLLFLSEGQVYLLIYILGKSNIHILSLFPKAESNFLLCRVIK